MRSGVRGDKKKVRERECIYLRICHDGSYALLLRVHLFNTIIIIIDRILNVVF